MMLKIGLIYTTDSPTNLAAGAHLRADRKHTGLLVEFLKDESFSVT
jgi:hypothetical protein